MGGPKWRILRAKLSSTFTAGKLKKMCETMYEKSLKLQKVLHKSAKEGEPIKPKEYLARYNNEVVLSCILGLEENTIENPDSIFREMGRKSFDPCWESLIRNACSIFLPEVAALLKVNLKSKDNLKFFSRIKG